MFTIFTLTEDYTYILSSSANGTSLMTANMVGLPEMVTSTQGGQSESLKYGYTAEGLNDKVWYRQGSGSWQLRSTVEYGSYGNPLAAYGPGSAWSSHPKTMEYLSNTASGVLAYKVYGVGTANALTGGSSYYAAGQLFVTKAADEDGKAVYTFTDKQGQKLLERAVNSSEYLDTYYVYDNYGNLCFVLQPEYQTTADLSKYAFQYQYDTLKRCTWKKLPGASGMTMEYDSADRLIFSQDGNGKWTWYEYDNLGRLTKQGENTTNVVTTTPNLQHYYDSYTAFRTATGSNSNFPDDTSGNSYGYLTGTVQTVLGTSTKLYTAYYYDNLGQVTKEVKSNLLGGG